MEIRNLETFIQVAERRSFTKAAEFLGYSQSTVSTQIKQLEDELDTLLFERINHRISLTERGEEILKYAYQITNLAKELQSGTPDPDNCEGLVRFAMAPSICDLMLGQTYMTFHEMYPNVTVKILMAETDEMIRQLNQNEADLIFIVDRHEYNKEHIIISEKKVNMHFVAGPEFELSNEKNINIKELVDYPFILTEKGLSYRKLFDEKLAEMYLEIIPIIEMGNTNLILELVEMNGGISFLPDYVTRKSYEEGKIVYLDVNDFEVEIWRQLLYHRDKWVSPAMQKVIDYCSGVSERI